MLSDILMWNKIGRIVTLLSERLDIKPEKALDIFYTSKTNERLHDPSTLLYTRGVKGSFSTEPFYQLPICRLINPLQRDGEHDGSDH